MDPGVIFLQLSIFCPVANFLHVFPSNDILISILPKNHAGPMEMVISD